MKIYKAAIIGLGPSGLAVNKILYGDNYNEIVAFESEDINKRDNAIQEATKHAILTPFRVMEVALDSMTVIKKMAEIGNPNSITDACVAALCARTAIRGAFLNVKINCLDCKDQKFVDDTILKGNQILQKAKDNEDEIIEITEKTMNS